MSTEEGDQQTQRRDHHEAVLKSMADGAFVVDSDWKLEYANEAALSNAGVSLEAIKDEPIMHLTEQMIANSEDPEKFERALETVYANDPETEYPVTVELKLDLPVGEIVNEYRCSPHSADGETKAVVIAREITERKEREQELERKQQFLQQTQKVASVGGWEVDLRAETLRWTDEVYRIHGVPLDENVTTEDGINFYHPEDRDMIQEAFERLTTEGEPYDLELRIVRADDEVRWVRTRGEPQYNQDGEIICASGTFQDITERKESERELERMKRAIEEAPIGVTISDPEKEDNPLIYVNDEYEKMTGYTAEDALGRNCRFLQDEQTSDEKVDEMREAIDEQRPVTVELRNYRKDGTEFWNRVSIAPVRDDDGNVINYAGFQQDITELIEREQKLRESNERLEQFAYVASHDLQEPLRTISNYTEILAEDYGDELDEEAQRIIDVAVTGSERMQSMINGLLDYSRVTTRGKEFEPVDTDQIVADTVADLEVMLEEHDGTVESGDLPTVEADGDQLHQVFQNLVKNALEHSGEDPINITIRASEENKQYRFEVEDDGPGIAQNRQEKIFRIFKSGEQYQTSSQAKGLGLAICDNIVRRHGGEIWVESEPGEGATFVFTIDKDKRGAATSMEQQ